MFEYVLVLYMSYKTGEEPGEYVGHFLSCAHAHRYEQKHFPEADYTVCLHEDYIMLPKDLTKIEKQ